MAGGSASALSLSRPAQALFTLRPVGSLSRLKAGSASNHVLGSARTLSKESDTLKGEVENFLATVRTV
jgi:hypothetical protein